MKSIDYFMTRKKEKKMYDVHTMSDEDLRLCYSQYVNNEWNSDPLYSFHKSFSGQLAAVHVQTKLLEEIAKRYCKM